MVWGLAAAGGKGDVSVAGSASIQVLTFDSTASVGKGSTLDSSGALAVRAAAPLKLQNLALAGALSTEGTAVGGAIVVSLLTTHTIATIDSGTGVGDITTVHAAGRASVTATGSLDPIKPETGLWDKLDENLPAVSSVALGGGAGGGDAAVTGSVIVDIINITTDASIGDGAKVNTGLGEVGGPASPSRSAPRTARRSPTSPEPCRSRRAARASPSRSSSM